MSKKPIILAILLIFFAQQGIIFLTIPSAKADVSIPSNFYDNLDTDSIYVYNVTKFGGDLNWLGFDYISKYNTSTNKGGQILVNFTGFYEKHPNDIFNAFKSPMPYMDIEFMQNKEGILISNHTFYNVSNGEVAFNTALGYNAFQSGFLLPINNVTHLRELALVQDSGFMPGEITIEESYNFISFDFKQDSKFQNTTLVYEKKTGLLIWARTKLAPITDPIGYTLEIFLNNYTLDLDTLYSYNVSRFNSVSFWYDWDFSYIDTWTTNAGGTVNVNFTGYYFRDSDDLGADIFPSDIKRAWLDIEIFYNGYFGPIGPQISLTNISNRETAIQMGIGFGDLQSGFLLPMIHNTTYIKQQVLDMNQGEIGITEEELTIEFSFYYETVGFKQETYLIYEKMTGLLQRVDTSAGGYSLAMRLIGFPYSKTSTPATPSDNSIPSFELSIFCLVVLIGSAILFKRIKTKIK
ncbi:MAG: hypothetical protein EU532_09885 [Promethearchaeota archaeon]|nr:MAG: hypothetical protein EU532_09885 [Candidatus Lokiarchaeota archaeon]